MELKSAGFFLLTYDATEINRYRYKEASCLISNKRKVVISYKPASKLVFFQTGAFLPLS